jgi:DNA polymerase-1
MPSRLLVIDAYSQIYRAFFAIRELSSPAGQPVNAVFGFAKMLQKHLTRYTPSHVAVVFDSGPPQRRLAIQPAYKAQRPPTPPALEPQLPILRDLLTAWRIPAVELEGEEADDLIATLAREARNEGLDVFIVSNDKDFAQLVTDHVRWLRNSTENEAGDGPAEVLARYGVRPDQIVDYLSLLGDSVDNIPGVKGIGPKTASALLQQFGSLEQLLARLPEVSQPKLQKSLNDAARQLRENQRMIILDQQVPLPLTLPKLIRQPPDPQRLGPLLDQLGFRTLRRELIPGTAAQPQGMLALDSSR